MTKKKNWRYTNSKQNPADLLSRGLLANALKLIAQAGFRLAEEVPELCSITTSIFFTKNNFDIFGKFSDLNQLKRVIAYCLRFKTNCLVD